MWFRVVTLVVCGLAVLRCASGKEIRGSFGSAEEVARHGGNEMSTPSGEELIKKYEEADGHEFPDKRKENQKPSDDKKPELNNHNNRQISNIKGDEKEKRKPNEELVSRPTEETVMVTEMVTNKETKLFTPVREQTTEEFDQKNSEEEKELCFDYLGCFSMQSPWKSTLRPIFAPGSPEMIAASILFYSRQNPEKEVNITLYPKTVMNGAKFDPAKPTAIMVHGFASSGNATWLKDLKDAYLQHVDANVMVVDWGKGSQLFNYLQVAGNTRLVARQLEIFVQELINEFGADPKKFHLIGHSLGAHICSYLAKSVPGFKRLTALDPAQPGFEGFDKRVRLHSSDADFVDVVHTDARPFIPTLGFGMMLPVGDVDFYMNGGFDQPGCLYPPKDELPMIMSITDLAKYPVERISDVVSCPHGRSYKYLTEAFKEKGKCTFWGHKASIPNVLQSATNTLTQGFFKKFIALPDTCSKDNCIPLGFDTDKSPLRGVFVITTGRDDPYCISQPGVPTDNSTKTSLVGGVVKKLDSLF